MQDDASHVGTVSGNAVLSPLSSFAPDCATFVTCKKTSQKQTSVYCWPIGANFTAVEQDTARRSVRLRGFRV